MSDQGMGRPEDTSTPAGAGAPADLGTRFLARLIDHVILGVVIFVLFVPLVIGAIVTGDGGFGFFGGFDAFSLLSGVFAAVIAIGYFAIMESQTGQTIGKMVLGLRTTGPTGANPTLEQAVRRNAWLALGIVPFLGGIAQLVAVVLIATTISQSPVNRGWHDDFAGGTQVLKRA